MRDLKTGNFVFPMIPGPDFVLKVPGCRRLVRIDTLTSANMRYARRWTDGKMECASFPDMPLLMKSRAEGTLFWVKDGKKVAEVRSALGFFWIQWVLKGVWMAATPTKRDYFAALTSGVATTDEHLRYVRTRIWWLGNDRLRSDRAPLIDLPINAWRWWCRTVCRQPDRLTPEHLANLEGLLPLLPEDDPQHRLQKAEVCRELGRFDEALALLTWAWPEKFTYAAAHIRSLVERREVTVAPA